LLPHHDHLGQFDQEDETHSPMKLLPPQLRHRLLLPIFAAVLTGCGAALPTPTPVPSPTATPAMQPPEQDSWILVDLPPDATQLQHGAEVYRLVCSACHAHSGEGLTDAWRATWHPEDQNCWQSKCHAANHPPDGFELPIAPAVVGRAALAPFATAKDLHDYIQATMPWQEPNMMTEAEGWAVTAYVIQLNRMNPGELLNADNAAEYRLHPEAPQPTPTAAAAVGADLASADPLRVLGGIALVAIAVFLAVRVTRQRRREQ
jgi:mono/diheme cytochrome c family protein